MVTKTDYREVTVSVCRNDLYKFIHSVLVHY